MSICRFRRPHLAVLVLLLAALTLPLAVAAPFRGGPSLAPAAGVGLAASSPIDPISLVKDINPNTLPSSPSDLVVGGHALYFTASDDRLQRMLWRLDSAALTLFSDSRFKNPANLAEMGGLLYFAAVTSANLASLWRSDGTYAGTNLLGTFPALPTSLTPAAGKLFFLVGYGLWETDGTPPGTHLVRSFASTGPDPIATPSNLTAVGARLFFSADDGSSGAELWISDGTLVGTHRVKDIYPGEICSETEHGPECAYASSAPADLRPFKGVLLFAASTAQGRTLWRSNGTAAATLPLAQPGAGPSDPAGLTVVGDALLFAATDDAHGYHELWKSDGTAKGTHLLKDINPGKDGASITELTAVGGTLFFSAYAPASGTALWKSDGTPGGTTLVKDSGGNLSALDPTELTRVGATLFFMRDDNQFGPSLWKSDGTAAGTMLVKSFPLDNHFFMLRELTALDGLLFLVADDGTTEAELWRSDGTTFGTQLVRDINTQGRGSNLADLTDVNGVLFFSATSGPLSRFDLLNRRDLWRSDGTAAGTKLVKVFKNYPPEQLIAVNGTLFFVLNDPNSVAELWKSDGTPAGTIRIQSFEDRRGGPDLLTRFGNQLYFLRRQALWKSDGTPAGTVVVKDLEPLGLTTKFGAMLAAGNTLFLTADDGVHGMELWKSDGTTAGSGLVKDIVPGASGSDLEFLATIGSTLFFSAQGQLWKSDGTPAGTVLVKDILPSDPAALNGTLFFTGYDTPHGFELWKSDGTPANTTMVKDIVPGSASSAPTNLTVRNGQLNFFTTGDLQAEALWQSDGTAAGTTLVKGFSGRDVRGLTNIGGTLLFYMIDPAQIWKSDGSAAGTVPIKNLTMSLDFPRPIFTLAGNHVFFGADDGVYGNELWAAEASDGVDAYLAAPALVGAPPAGAATIPIAYNNKGMSVAASTVLTATLAPGLTYLGDTSGATPMLSGNSVSWRLPEIEFLSERRFTLRLGVPAASFGARYAVGLQLTTDGVDLRPADNIAQIEVLIAHQRYLPAVGR